VLALSSPIEWAEMQRFIIMVRRLGEIQGLDQRILPLLVGFITSAPYPRRGPILGRDRSEK
jgi:hypothetical protein